MHPRKTIRLALGALTLAAALSLGRIAAEGPPPAGGTLPLYFSGDREGGIDPCGCPSIEQGGVVHEAGLYPAGESLRLDAGGWTSALMFSEPDAWLRSQFLLRGLAEMQYDAVNVGQIDIHLTRGWYDHLRQEYPLAYEPLISANTFLKDARETRAFAAYRLLERRSGAGERILVGVTGAVSTERSADGTGEPPEELETESFVVRDPAAVLPGVVRELRAAGAAVVIVLFDGDDRQTQRMRQAAADADVLITTGDAPAGGELRAAGPTVLRTPHTRGRQVGHAEVEIAGGGLRRVVERPPLSVRVDLSADPTLELLVGEYQALAAQTAPAASGDAGYAGVDACARCHEQPYRAWRETAHARAFRPLLEEGRMYDAEALRRRVTGWGEAGGFVSVLDGPSRELLNVQCEACHGPGRAHAEMEARLAGAGRWLPAGEREALEREARQRRPPVQVPEAACLPCHDPARDPAFNFKRDIRRVDHDAGWLGKLF